MFQTNSKSKLLERLNLLFQFDGEGVPNVRTVLRVRKDQYFVQLYKNSWCEMFYKALKKKQTNQPPGFTLTLIPSKVKSTVRISYIYILPHLCAM